jgi:hypothetical protein
MHAACMASLPFNGAADGGASRQREREERREKREREREVVGGGPLFPPVLPPRHFLSLELS